MCLLTFMQDTATITYEQAKKAAIANPDGFGFAIHTGKSIVTDHDMNFNHLWDRFDMLRKVQNGPALFHWRIATHGTTTRENCHPFPIGGTQESVLAHNGILPIPIPLASTYSDTRMFAEVVLPHAGGVTALDDPKFIEKLEEWVGWSKLVVLTTDKDAKSPAYIINEAEGHWDKDFGIWWSNHSYEPRVYTYAKTGYSGGYKTHDYGDIYSDDYRSSGSILVPTPDEIEEYGDYLTDAIDDEALLTGSYETIMDYLIDEVYLDGKDLKRIQSFTQFIDESQAIVTCYSCSETLQVDPLDPSSTHCGRCKACLSCGQFHGCQCWDGYEYGQAFTQTKKETWY